MGTCLRALDRLGLEETLAPLVLRMPSGGDQAFRVAQALMVLRAILVLEPWLDRESFLALLVVQCQGMARFAGEVAVDRPEGSYGELQLRAAPDMALAGFKPVAVHLLEDLERRLNLDRALLPLAQTLVRKLPEDLQWNRLARRRLEGKLPEPVEGDPVELLCTGSLRQALDALGWRLRHSESVLDLLVRASTLKLAEADLELQGRTAWLFTFMASLESGRVEGFLQAGALVHLFPSEGEPLAFFLGGGGGAGELAEAILDGDPRGARKSLQGLPSGVPVEELLQAIIPAAAASDPMADTGFRLLALAGVVELLPRLTPGTARLAVGILAWSLAVTQGAGELVAGVRRRLDTRWAEP
nr:hypothetical protein [uncultured Holophaga sp.]